MTPQSDEAVRGPARGAPGSMRSFLRQLYFGAGPGPRLFRYGLVAFDALVIIVFLLASTFHSQSWLPAVDFLLGLLMAAELGARLYADSNRRKQILSVATATDAIVIASLFLPAFVDNLGFLRVVRAVRLLRSYQLLRDLRADSPWFRRYEDIIQRTLTLGIFIFVVTSFVYVTQHNINPGIVTYVDALYFTITTLTTTGFGDITLIGTGGRFLAVLIMVVGVALFLRLLQAVFRPSKVRFECPDCALQIHDIDAVHCKHCGRVLPIPTEGVV